MARFLSLRSCFTAHFCSAWTAAVLIAFTFGVSPELQADAEWTSTLGVDTRYDDSSLVFVEPKTDAPNPFLVGLLSEVWSGGGYFLIERPDLGWWGSANVALIAQGYLWTADNWHEKSVKSNLSTIGRNVHGFMVYDSFQKALEYSDYDRKNLVIDTGGYSFAELATAPFQARSYASWKPFLPLALIGHGVVERISTEGIVDGLSWERGLLGLTALYVHHTFVGLGEEAEFRGFQQPAFAQATGSRFWGNILQSASFGLCHTRSGYCSSPYASGNVFRNNHIVDLDREYFAPASPSDGQDATDAAYFTSSFLFGLYMGWMLQSEKDGLLMATATHTLTNFMLSATDLLTTGNTGRMYLTVEFPLP